ncbi:MAG: DUF47 family protein, partial [Proteobacteria bacterium]|nr:DUF47 family protein [Pseudomonadota bacterium]
MKFSLLPKEEKFFDLLQSLIQNTVEATGVLQELGRSWSPTSPAFARLEALDTKTQDMRHEIVRQINATFVTPIDREDIHAVAAHITCAFGRVHALTLRLQVYAPDTLPEACSVLIDVLARASQCAAEMIRLLPSFKDCSAQRKEMATLEKKADHVYREALGGLFVAGSDPLYVIKWKDIYESLEDAVDECDNLCDLVESIIIKHG